MAATAQIDTQLLELATAPLPAVIEPEENDERQARIQAIAQSLDVMDSSAIVRFGSMAQSELQTISQNMLKGVKAKDAGPAGESLGVMVSTLRGFRIAPEDGRNKATWWERLTGKMTPFARLMARFENVQDQIDRIANGLVTHESTLLKDIRSLDLLYAKTLDFYHELALYIDAGQTLLARLDEQDIPKAEKAVETASEDQKMLMAQALRDLRSRRDDLERRIHDLKLTRQVTMQTLPSLRLIQENDKALVGKIASTLTNTIPLWETQIAQALTIQRSREAAAAVRAANDLTNELLTANADNLRQANAEVKREIERGVFDIEAVQKANAALIATIEDSLQIATEGKTQRAEAEKSLVAMEAQLRDTLSKAKA